MALKREGIFIMPIQNISLVQTEFNEEYLYCYSISYLHTGLHWVKSSIVLTCGSVGRISISDYDFMISNIFNKRIISIFGIT